MLKRMTHGQYTPICPMCGSPYHVREFTSGGRWWCLRCKIGFTEKLDGSTED